ncbi:hypothetical protein [Enterococcus malodoratus]|uniref:Uncharacterized protein n=1 Tax=Enterococcus malodoratus ATCC 43197 TaxID=1158601 RepID=R2P5R0_9ENTE|nr:hypothetical protein [Enterococcus malodoratus]EOH79657.1 hypothetical protein UAI_01238 [Enterococcus malodoratus ATCC 43197]EOT64980.1 hypothetical protein I585_04182 [Enterococcus malodoratus ATCC 43197]SPW86777.1 Uncharacterised protein [Enterococcus malodoratus]STC72113.1 Uncharacterised protein [Enterococcus malodoratus]
MKTVKEIVSSKGITLLSPYPGGGRFKWTYNNLDFLVIATDIYNEEHVSVSHSDRSIKPTKQQMSDLVNIFFRPFEDVHLYMKDDGDDLLVSNCYHIYRKHNEISGTFVMNPKNRKK